MASSNDKTELYDNVQLLAELVKVTTENMIQLQDRLSKLEEERRVSKLEEERSNAQLHARVSKLEQENKVYKTQGKVQIVYCADATRYDAPNAAGEGRSAGGKMAEKKTQRPAPYQVRSQDPPRGHVPVPQPVPPPQNPTPPLLTNWQQYYDQIFQLLGKVLKQNPSWRRSDGDIADPAVKMLLQSGNFLDLAKMRRGYVPGKHGNLLNQLSFRVLYYDTLKYIKALEEDKLLVPMVGHDLVVKIRSLEWTTKAKFDQESNKLTRQLRDKVHEYLQKKYPTESQVLADLLGSNNMSAECCKHDPEALWRRRAEEAQRLVRKVVNADPAWRQADTEISALGLSELKISREDFRKWHNIGHPVIGKIGSAGQKAGQWFQETTERLERIILYFDTRLRVKYLQTRQNKLDKDILRKVFGNEPSKEAAIDRYIKMKEGDNVSDKHATTTRMRAMMYDYDPRILLLLSPSLQAPGHMRASSASEQGYWAC